MTLLKFILNPPLLGTINQGLLCGGFIPKLFPGRETKKGSIVKGQVGKALIGGSTLKLWLTPTPMERDQNSPKPVTRYEENETNNNPLIFSAREATYIKKMIKWVLQ